MADLVTTIRVRVLALLIRRGVIEDSAEQLVLLPDGLAEDEPVLSQVSSAAASGLPPAGPERREREHMRIARSPGASITGGFCAADMGFTVHAATIAPPPPAADGARKARSTWRPWPELLKRSFDIDIQCSKCGGSMQLKALLRRSEDTNSGLVRFSRMWSGRSGSRRALLRTRVEQQGGACITYARGSGSEGSARLPRALVLHPDAASCVLTLCLSSPCSAAPSWF